MRRGKIQLCITLTAISFLVLGTNLVGVLNIELPVYQKSVLTYQNSPLPAVNHDPIYIDGDGALSTFIANEVLSGDGTYGSPYVIENFNIDASTAHGIDIRNTDAYLIIQNCTVSGGSSFYNGIYLNGVENVIVINNVLTENKNGIRLSGTPISSSCSNNTISGNTASYNENSGIGLMLTDNSILSENNVNYNGFSGINLVATDECIISGNRANYNEISGIFMVVSDNNTLVGNLMIGGGITLFSCDDNSIDTTNKLNDKSVRYYYNTNGIHLSGEIDVGQVILIKCNDSTIENVSISTAFMGIMVTESPNCFLIDNLINDCFNGIYLDASNGTTLSGNYLTSTGLYVHYSYDCDIDTTNKVNGKSLRFYENTPEVYLSEDSDVGQVILINCDDSVIEGLSIVDTVYGIYILNSTNCSISNNTIFNCISGFYLVDSSYNSLSWNTLSNNREGIDLTGSFPRGGPYLTGSNNNTLTENIVYNNEEGIRLSISSNNTIYHNDIYGNQFESLAGDINNQCDNGTMGNYWGDDYITQNPGATNDGTFWDTPFSINWAVVDNFPLVNPIFTDVDAPVFVIIPADINVDEGYTGLKVSWTAIDLHPTTYNIELDGTEVVLATEWSGGLPIFYNIPDGLSIGQYSITIILSDINGKSAQKTVNFSVGTPISVDPPFNIPGFPLMTTLISIFAAVLMLRRKFNHLKLD